MGTTYIYYKKLGTHDRGGTVKGDVIKVSEGDDHIFIVKQFIPQLCCDMLNSASEFSTITFDTCWIREIEEECFSAAVQHVSKTIKIINNRLTSVKKRTFRNLQLKEILLNGNLIQTLEDEAFFNLTNLGTIDLGYNRLKVLNPEAFSLLPNLENLILQHNRIQALQARVFSFFSRRAYILLTCNQIKRIEGGLNGMFSQITLMLEMSGNNVEELSNGVFSNHTFGILDLANNPLKKISPSFCENCNVESFYFSCRYLTLEDVQMIANWGEDYRVYLYGNGCPQYNMTFAYESPQATCNQEKSSGVCFCLFYLGVLINVIRMF
ncbi:hypothetical protein Zmor_022217 [Zophobas morio]|uniref:Uncharacterized protein n=1 Tax=Zophobas morio TaxID=2755281 RepID=A0AA38HWK0_9CUCU|nr:hypothetical protein Zmor_022217 [Zophobas morio]